MEGIDPKLAAEMKYLGIRNLEQLESLSLDERRQLEARIASKGLKWDWGWLSNWKTAIGLTGLSGVAAVKSASGSYQGQTTVPAAPASVAGGHVGTGRVKIPGLNFASPTGPDENWSKVGGTKVAHQFKLLGITSINQLENLSFAERRKLEDHLRQQGVIWDSNRISTWKRELAGSAATSSVANSSTSQTAGKTEAELRQSRIGFGAKLDSSGPAQDKLVAGSTMRLFEGKPEFKDDLTLLDGIDGPQAAELQKMGIYNFTPVSYTHLTLPTTPYV